MAKEHFPPIIEVASLLKSIEANKREQREQEKRRHQLDQRRQGACDHLSRAERQISDLRQEISFLEVELARLDKQKEQAQRAHELAQTTQAAEASERQLQSLKIEINQIEESVLEKLDLTEQLLVEQSDQQSFLKGIEETEREIRHEVETACRRLQNEIDQLEQRIIGRIQEIPIELKEKFDEARRSHPHDPLTKLSSQRSCTSCKRLAEGQLAGLLERGECFELCQGCFRLFVPSD